MSAEKKQTMLYVEDDPGVYQATLRILRQFLPDVMILTATNLDQALHLVHDCPPFDVVFTDFNLQKDTCIDLIMTVLSRYPNTPIIVTSGDYRNKQELERDKIPHIFVLKPVPSLSKLVIILRKELQKNRQ